MNLAGSSAIVTGGAVRIGRAIALALAELGVDVCVHYGTSQDEAERTAGEIRARGVKAVTVSADLREPVAAAGTVVDAAVQAFGSVEILVNSAAIFEESSLLSTDAPHVRRHFAINLESPLFLAQAFVRQLPADRRGHVLNLVDWRALRPLTGHLVYTLTKSALESLTRMLAQELAPRIQVNGIAPGAILPPPGSECEPWERQKSGEVPLQRVGSSEEIARAAVFLLQSDFVTGEILHVTGGEQL